jgi:hypothetical protein
MSKIKWWLLLSALLFAAPLGAQPRGCDRDCSTAPARKVWRDEDLRKPLPLERRAVDAEALAGLQRRAEAQFPPAGAPWPAQAAYYPPEPAAAPSAALPFQSSPSAEPQRYAEQPLYPFVYLLQSRQPLRWRAHRPRPPEPPAAAPRPEPRPNIVPAAPGASLPVRRPGGWR